METIGRAANDGSAAFRVVTSQIKTMIRRPHDIHRLIQDFTRSQGVLATWLLNLQNHPLAVDWIMIHPPDYKAPSATPNVFQTTIASITTFIGSFTRDYTGLGSTYRKGEEKVLEVWVGRGTEWGQIMKDMIEDDFTPNTGIKVNLRVIPPASIGEGAGSVLLLATTAGEAPDVAVGVPSNLPVDFAVRGGLVNLSDFPDYRQVAGRFREGALIPFRYTLPGKSVEGNWAIPETQDFAMTFYRTDILHELELNPPDTWDDVYDALLKLQQNGLDFYYPPPTGVAVTEGSVGFTPFLFQNGGEYYNCNNRSSAGDVYCRSALTTPEALTGFQEWTDLYSNYKIPREANFFTRLRTGEQPVGVSGYGVYISLSVAAPELTGRWEMRPMPGHRCGVPSIATGYAAPCPPGVETGTILRTSGGTGQSMVIFQQSDAKDEAWEFVKWWSSASSQQRFGGELEALIGVEARWNTANLEALAALPLPRKDIASILEQWRWFKEPPVVLGGYFTGRHVLNAWNRVVLQGMNPREALEEAVYDINKELAKKQEEFGLHVDPAMYRRGG
jgi:ABC-type glycerol-3-phosphate transport system substrate-binding protein